MALEATRLDARAHVGYRVGVALHPQHLIGPSDATTAPNILRIPCCNPLELYVTRAGRQGDLQEDLQRMALISIDPTFFDVFISYIIPFHLLTPCISFCSCLSYLVFVLLFTF